METKMKPKLVLDLLVEAPELGHSEYMVRRVDRKVVLQDVAVIRRSFPEAPIIRFCQGVDLTEFDLTKIRIMMNRIKRNVA